jgi:hypothetical protein
MDADTLQDPIVAAGRTWTLAPLTIGLGRQSFPKIQRSEKLPRHTHYPVTLGARFYWRPHLQG